ncbi:VOC family protein [Streptomyces sp. A7024]|uniref:VOC family protein n=2 Tax=Streptomyces coryli TaxID=1128680 RepID=A0A6G4U699_9ACTN|nr:VOC family protein [Streptomyces coryli]NGN66721.1 VOC family protein [Streptomyces coryli]
MTPHPRTPGMPCWASLMVHDLEATQDFYSALFGWEFRPGPQQLGPYVRALLDDREVAGIGVLATDRHLRLAWTTYLATDDADATADRVRYCGGTVAVGPLDAEDAGRLAVCSDTAGAVFGIWQAGRHEGAQRHGTPGSTVWNDLLTAETPAAAAAKFYENVFGYAARETGPDQITLEVEGHPVAAICGGDGHETPHWMTYFGAADVDAAAKLVIELGGRVRRGPYDGDYGRAVEVADPEGAVFTMIAAGTDTETTTG